MGDLARNVHLDTTVMTDCLLKGQSRRHKVKEVISRYGHSTTSRFVKTEFKRTPMQYLVYIHNKLWQVKSFGELLQAISMLPPIQQRRLKSIVELFVGFFDVALSKLDEQAARLSSPLSHNDYLMQVGRAYFANLIENSWDAFDVVTDEVIDPENAFPDMVAPRRVRNLFSNMPRTCDKSTIRCGCRKFYSKHALRLEAIYNALTRIADPDEETKRRIRSMHEILRKPGYLREKDCWNCGDATIVCEAPSDSAVFNNNAKHFQTICAALAVPMETYS